MTPLNITSLCSDIWQKAKSELALALPGEVFDSWFKNIDCIGGDENKIVLGTPSELAPFWISDNYFDVLSRNISLAASRNIDVEIKVVGAEEKPAEEPVRESARRIKQPAAPVFPTSINPRNTFESFVVGEGNKFAHAAALAVAQSVGKAFNPLLLYGATGLGKTHLMHAIAHFIIKNDANAKVVYISSETFVNEYINALSSGNISSFRRRYRNTDVLLIDDIQFFSRKESSQEEFFHTFNELFNSNKQIVLSCDRPIQDVPDIEKRLVSRFEWGVCVDIKSPDYETRLAILRKKVSALGDCANINGDVLDLIARRFTKNVRRMEGALNKIIGYSSLISNNSPMTLEKAHYLLADDLIQEDGGNVIDVEQIQKKTAEYHRIDAAELCGKRRPANIALARQIAMYLSRKLTTQTLQEIGRRFGGRDHGTVMHAIRVVDHLINHNENVKREVEHLTKTLSS